MQREARPGRSLALLPIRSDDDPRPTRMIEGPFEGERVRALREALTATGAGIYLSTHLAGPMPAETLAAVRESDDLELRLGRSGPDRVEDLAQRDKEARAVVGAVLRAAPDRMVLTHGVSEAARLVCQHVLAARGDGGTGHVGDDPGPSRILLHEALDPLVAASLRFTAAAAGARAEAMPRVQRDVQDPAAALVVPCIDADGRVFDVPRLARAAHAQGAALVVDAGMAAGAVPLDVAALGADAVITDTHRWLLGPEAVAVAWLGPTLGEGAPEAVREVVGSFGRGPLLALARSVGWLLMYVDLPWVLERTGRLARRLHAGLRGIGGVEVADARGVPDVRRVPGPIVAFRVRGWPAEQAADELSRSVFAILEADTDRDLLRASVGAWNREEELDRLVARVAALAAHTPESLPRRPALVVLHRPGEDA
jgi:selenocysteine lyase/cysteine desulfurase